MLYFHNTSKELQKLALCAAKAFSFWGGFAPQIHLSEALTWIQLLFPQTEGVQIKD